MHGCDDFILALRAGFMHNDIWGTKATVTAHDLGLGRHDDFEILLGGDEPGAVVIPDGVLSASIREYYFDWTADEPAFFTIECLDPEPAPVLDGPTFANRVRRAMMQMTDSIERWNAYMVMNRAERIDNTFTNRTLEVSKGLSMARYEFCFWDLAPDQALVVTAEVPRGPLLGRPALHDGHVRVGRHLRPHLLPQPHPDHHRLRRQGPLRGVRHRPRHRQLARHRQPPQRPLHPPLVLAHRQPSHGPRHPSRPSRKRGYIPA